MSDDDPHADLRWMLDCKPIDECPFANHFETIEEALDLLGPAFAHMTASDQEAFHGKILVPLEDIMRDQGDGEISA